MHFKLYEGYVKEPNRLTEAIAEILKDGRVDQEEMPAYSELKRRLGFEYNGMVLHEYYFSNLKKGGGEDPARNSAFLQAVDSSFGSYDLMEGGLHQRRQGARGRMGDLLPGSATRPVVQPLGHVA